MEIKQLPRPCQLSITTSFALEPGELGCMDLAKHEIRLLMRNPSRRGSEEFPLLWWMKSVHTWRRCWKWALSTIVKVCKKDGDLHFCIDFHKLNARTKKDSYPLPQIQEAIESLVGAGCFSCLDLKAGICKLPWMKHQNSTPLSLWRT